jgi:hypothetical protein
MLKGRLYVFCSLHLFDFGLHVIGMISLWQIDYGDLYELQRVRCNYPRIRGQELANTRRFLELCDKEALEDFSQYTPIEIHDCLSFLESLFIPTWSTELVKLQRSLLVALSLRRRICTLGGLNDISEHDTLRRSQIMVKSICDSFGGGERFRHGILSYELLRKSIVECFGGGAFSTVEALPTPVLYNQIVTWGQTEK